MTRPAPEVPPSIEHLAHECRRWLDTPVARKLNGQACRARPVRDLAAPPTQAHPNAWPAERHPDRRPHMTYFTANLTLEEDEVRAEMARQDAKWGQQNHADGTGPDVFWGVHPGPAEAIAVIARGRCKANGPGQDTWRDILFEEVAEAIAEDDPDALLAELLQVEAVARQWRMAIRRRLATPNTPTGEQQP
jgi:hypothetical protein